MARGEGTDREFLYEYSLKDHLGNSRVTFMGTDLGGAVDIVQTTNYYPFGLVMSQTNETHSQDYRKNMYLYNEGFSALNIAAMYNGNISGMKWKNGSAASVQKGYGFTYDQVNRLTTSKYGEGSYFTTYLNRYCENMTYDKNGNILKLLRSGQTSTGVFGRLDSLTYKYTNMGNQVRAISDSVPDITGRGDFFDGTNGNNSKEYYYDKNGNMWLDRNKRMKIVYNYLNLPAQVIDTVTPANKIEYVYTAAGEKLKQRLSTGTTLLYLGNFVYKLDGTANGIAVNYILTQEGRATNSAGTYTYEYFMKDHLGNTRVSFNVPSTTAIIVQQNDYYPFGMIHQPQATATSDNRYLYNGKELQNNLLGGVNLDWYDYGARFYDAQIGRWHVIDNYSEHYFDFSPYQYAANNPILFIDINGDSLNVAEENRKIMQQALESIYGQNAKYFSYTKSGMLVYNGSTKGFSKEEKNLFKGLNNLIGQEKTTYILFQESVTLHGVKYNANDRGGGLSIMSNDANTILINPNAPSSMQVNETLPFYYNEANKKYLDIPIEGLTTKTTTVQTNTNDIFWHEIGEVYLERKLTDKVLDYNNIARGILKSSVIVPTNAPGYDKGSSGYTKKVFMNSPLSPRNQDITHNSLK